MIGRVFLFLFFFFFSFFLHQKNVLIYVFDEIISLRQLQWVPTRYVLAMVMVGEGMAGGRGEYRNYYHDIIALPGAMVTNYHLQPGKSWDHNHLLVDWYHQLWEYSGWMILAGQKISLWHDCSRLSNTIIALKIQGLPKIFGHLKSLLCLS